MRNILETEILRSIGRVILINPGLAKKELMYRQPVLRESLLIRKPINMIKISELMSAEADVFRLKDLRSDAIKEELFLESRNPLSLLPLY